MSSRPSRGAARLAAILDALPDGLVLVNANGTVVNANSIALEMFESPGTALVGRGLLDLLPQFDSKLIPGSMRRPDSADHRGRTKPTRMVARRTDGAEFPVEVTSASLEDGRAAYNDAHNYTGDELLMLVVRDLSGTMDTEAELARSQRQTEMILRAASEGVVGTDTDGRVVLVNPAAAQILGFRATDLGGRELHTLVLHSRANGDPFPYDESPLADTLRSGRKHRVRGQVLWAKNGSAVPVDLTTAPVRDGDQLVGAVMTFTDRRAHDEMVKEHTEELTGTREKAEAELTRARERAAAELAAVTERLEGELKETTERLTEQLEQADEDHAAELADRSDRYAAEIEELTERYEFVSARHAQLTAVLAEALRGPLEELRNELSVLATDPAGQLWPEANQILHHLSAGYARMTTLVDNVLGYQRLDAGLEQLAKARVLLDGVVAAGVEGAIELIGPGRMQFAVHAPPIEVEVDPGRLATALAHLVADVAGVDATGRTRVVPQNGYVDSTIVVAAAQRGNVVRIEVRGPFEGGDPVHEPIVSGIVRAHGGVLQTHEVPGMSGRAFVLELPLGEGLGTVAPQQTAQPADPTDPSDGTGTSAGTRGGSGRRRARRSSTDAFLEPAEDEGAEPTGRRRARAAQADTPGPGAPGPSGAPQEASGGTGRRRGRVSPEEAAATPPVPAPASAQAPAAEGTTARSTHPNGLAAAVPPNGVPVGAANGGHRARHGDANALPALPSSPFAPQPAPPPDGAPLAPVPAPAVAGIGSGAIEQVAGPGRRSRRALAPAPAGRPADEPRQPFALPPAEADRTPAADAPGREAAVGLGRMGQPPFWPEPGAADSQEAAQAPYAAAGGAAPHAPGHAAARPPVPGHAPATPDSASPVPAPQRPRRPMASQPLPDETPPTGTAAPDSTQGRAFSVRTLGQGVQGTPFPADHAHPGQGQTGPVPTGQAAGPGAAVPAPGRRRKLGTRADDEHSEPEPARTPPRMSRRPVGQAGPGHPGAGQPDDAPGPPTGTAGAHPGGSRLGSVQAEGRSYAIGAPDEGAAEGPEMLDGPGGAVEVTNRPQPRPVDDELPPEPLDNPRRLLVWPAPDVSTQQALSERGYRPVVVHSREEVDAQIAAFPAALFVDPLTGPITRTALQSLRQAAVAAGVPVLVTAGLGQANRDAAYGADPAVLLKALAPRDSEQHPPRVLLMEGQEEIALALTASLERRGMQVARAAEDNQAVALASQMRPNLVVMDLMQVRRRQAGIIDWLRANGQLSRTPLVVYTSVGIDPASLPRLASGETVLFLAERSTSVEVQARIVDLLAKIGTN